MFHSILTILTTSAVALHALLGCCAHHSHACHEQPHAIEVAAVQCPHHHGHDDQLASHGSEADYQGHQHHGDHQKGDEPCDTPDCSFVSNQHGQDVTLALTLAMSLPVIGDVDSQTSLNGSHGQRFGPECSPGCLRCSGCLRANTQVRLL